MPVEPVPQPAPAAPRRKSGVVIPNAPRWYQRLMAFLIWLCISAVAKTIRFRIHDPHGFISRRDTVPMIFCFWHNRLLLCVELYSLFRLLVNSVSGIGPKTALNILSGMNAVAFRGAVASSDVKALSQISGVGKKTAERIVVELRDKIGAAGALEAASARHGLSPDDQKINDAVLALMALGFKQLEAHDSVRAAQAMLGVSATVEDLVRACLKKG